MAAQVEGPTATGPVEASYKGRDVEAYIDILFYRRIGFWLAKFFVKLKLTPNQVSLIGCLVGLLAGHFYFYRNLAINVAGMLLHVLANAVDNADGQLARITGNRNRFGRIVDGLADHLVFAGIYVHLALRCGPTLGWIVSIALCLAAAISHALQSAAADYFRSVYLLLNGANTARLDSTASVREELRQRSWRDNTWEKLLLSFYLNFTRQQEMLAPRLRYLIRQPGISSEYSKSAAPLIKWLNALMTNPRMFVLFAALLFDRPGLYFIAELTVFNAILAFVLIRHEQICGRFVARPSSHGS